MGVGLYGFGIRAKHCDWFQIQVLHMVLRITYETNNVTGYLIVVEF